MSRDIAMDCRTEMRRKYAERQYLDCCRTWSPDIREEAESRLILHESFSSASHEQYQLARRRAQGYNVKEAAHMEGIPVKQARKLLEELRKVCVHLNI